MKTLRIGFIGAGWISEIHAASLLRVPAVVIAAVYNHRRPRAEALIAKHVRGQARVFDDWKKMFDTVSLDAVFVALPPGAHDGQVEYAAEKGLHLLLEKPIALSLARADSIARAVSKAGVHCTIGHHMRHAAPARRLKVALADGSAGRPLFMQGRFFANNLFPAWWRDPALGGGQLIEQAIHIYDLARYFFGEPDTVTSFTDRLFHDRHPDYRVDDVSAATIRFRNRGVASLSAANCYEPHRGSTQMTVLCENVAVEFADYQTATFAWHGGRKSEELRAEDVKRETVATDYNVYDEQAANFVSAVRGQSSLRSGIKDGLEGLRLVMAAAESAAQCGTPVTVSAVR